MKYWFCSFQSRVVPHVQSASHIQVQVAVLIAIYTTPMLNKGIFIACLTKKRSRYGDSKIQVIIFLFIKLGVDNLPSKITGTYSKFFQATVELFLSLDKFLSFWILQTVSSSIFSSLFDEHYTTVKARMQISKSGTSLFSYGLRCRIGDEIWKQYNSLKLLFSLLFEYSQS